MQMKLHASIASSVIVTATLLVTAITGGGWARPSHSDRLLVTGWAVAHGEIRIYPRREDVGRLFDGSCISGVMTHGRQMPANLQNRRVAAYGSFMSVAALNYATAHGASIGVANNCASTRIALISHLEPVSDR